MSEAGGCRSSPGPPRDRRPCGWTHGVLAVQSQRVCRAWQESLGLLEESHCVKARGQDVLEGVIFLIFLHLVRLFSSGRESGVTHGWQQFPFLSTLEDTDPTDHIASRLQIKILLLWFSK